MKIGAKLVRLGRYVTFQMAEVAVPSRSVEVYLNNEKSSSIWPLAAVWIPSFLPYGQKLVSTFPEAPSSAIIGSRLTGPLGNVGNPRRMCPKLCRIRCTFLPVAAIRYGRLARSSAGRGGMPRHRLPVITRHHRISMSAQIGLSLVARPLGLRRCAIHCEISTALPRCLRVSRPSAGIAGPANALAKWREFAALES